MDIILSIFMLLGGLALFLYGMNVMSVGLERTAGNKLEAMLRKMTSNPFKALLLGTLGTAVAQAIHDGCHVANVDIPKLQATLMEDDCFIPWHDREVSPLSKSARVSDEVVRNGIDRGEANLWIGKEGDSITYEMDKDTEVKELRLVFDSDLNRNYDNMPCCFPLEEKVFKLPNTLIKEYRIEGESEDGTVHSITVTDGHLRFVKHFVNWKVKRVRFIPLATQGADTFRLFSFEIK